MSERVPEGWKAENLGDIAGFSGGNAFKEIYQGQGIGTYPFIKVSDMNLTGNERYITKSNNWVSEKTRKEAKVKLFPSNSTVFAKVGAALLLNRRRQLVRETAIDNNMMAAIPSNCDHHFLYYFMQSIDLKTIVQSGAVPSVNQSQMESIPVNTPPLPEQKKIASILTSVDEVIEKTQSQIDKLQDLKKGTMNELLTKGIGHTEFKDSELGRIPKSWEVKQLDDLMYLLTDFEANGSFADVKANVSIYETKNYAWYVRATDLEKNTPLSKVKYVDKKTYDFLHKTVLEDNEILIAKRGEIGKVYFYKNKGVPATAAPNTYVLRLRDLYDSYFLYIFLTSPRGNMRLRQINASTTIGALYKNDIKKFKVPFPSLGEQKQISSVILGIECKISSLKQKLHQTQSLKKSLMQDLLTGKVRVSVN